MKCNYQRKQSVYSLDNLRPQIHDSMSYEEILRNVMSFPDNMIPKYPTKIMQKLVRTQTPYGRTNFLLDISSLKTLGLKDDMTVFTPLTADLLELYGKTPQQFIEDFFSPGVFGIEI